MLNDYSRKVKRGNGLKSVEEGTEETADSVEKEKKVR